MRNIVWDGMMVFSSAAANVKSIAHAMHMKKLKYGCMLLVVAVAQWLILGSALAQELPEALKRKFEQAGIPETALGIYIHPIGVEQPIVAVNANVAMNPASVMKLVTTYAGLEILGPAYSWQTVLYAHGKITDGVLHGDLVIKGYGDPKLDLENFWLLIHRLRHRASRDYRQSDTGSYLL